MVIGGSCVALTYYAVSSTGIEDVSTLAAVWAVAATVVGLPFAYFLGNFRHDVRMQVQTDGIVLRGEVWGEPTERLWTWKTTQVEARTDTHADPGGSKGPRIVLRHPEWGRLVICPTPAERFPQVVRAIESTGATVHRGP